MEEFEIVVPPQLENLVREVYGMPKELEAKLKKEYGAKSDIPYKIMNKMGVMKGNQETAKGKAMEKKSEAKKGK
jgi:hypothetical protein